MAAIGVLHGEWIFVPELAVVTEPNCFGPAVVWPYMDAGRAYKKSAASCRAPVLRIVPPIPREYREHVDLRCLRQVGTWSDSDPMRMGEALLSA